MDFAELTRLAQNAHQDEKSVVDAEGQVFKAKQNAAEMKDKLGLEISRATLEALEAGKITGKNEKIRECEIELYLAQHPVIPGLRLQVRDAESAINGAETWLGLRKAMARLSRSILEAALQTARTAEPVAVLVQRMEPKPVMTQEKRPVNDSEMPYYAEKVESLRPASADSALTLDRPLARNEYGMPLKSRR